MDNNISGILFAIATSISWAIGIFPFTEAARRLGVNALNHFRLLLATLLIVISTLFIDHRAFTSLFSFKYEEAWLWLGLSGLIGLALGDYLAFKMYAILGAKTGSILTTFSPAAALLFGIYLLDEKINIIGISGMILTITGVIGISFSKGERIKIPDNKHGKITNGIIYGVLAAVCQGAGLVFAKKGFVSQEQLSEVISPVNATFIRMLISVLALSLMTLLIGRTNEVLSPLLSNKNSGLRYAVAGTFFGPFLGVCLALITITTIDVAVAQTIFSLVPVIALIIAFVFLKEKISFLSLAGIVIAILGVIILIWRNTIILNLTG